MTANILLFFNLMATKQSRFSSRPVIVYGAAWAPREKSLSRAIWQAIFFRIALRNLVSKRVAPVMLDRVRRDRRRMARPPTPLQQGDLDGLCGAYALVNAVTRLLHNRGFQREDANRLFQRLCRTLHRRQRMPQAVWRGAPIHHNHGMPRTVRRFRRGSFSRTPVVS